MNDLIRIHRLVNQTQETNPQSLEEIVQTKLKIPLKTRTKLNQENRCVEKSLDGHVMRYCRRRAGIRDQTETFEKIY
ncbi:hypothetical protein TNCV_2322051 [Trichonephila clavipes]|nr:hypothetical protein TNCV_2322051 [Trichonephila clavipes]